MDRVCLQICTFNRGHLLKWTLEKLTKLTKPDEVMIISDGCTDNTEEIVKSFENKLPIRYIYNHSPECSIASYARNIGVKNTDCEIIITIEPELLPLVDFIPMMVRLHQENPNQVISAGTIYHGGINSKTTQELVNNPYKILNDGSLVNEDRLNNNPRNTRGYAKVVNWVASFSALYRKEWLMNINGWCEGYETYAFEDTDCLTRLRANGINQKICSEIEFIHQYHDKLAPNVSMKATLDNEKKFLNKNFDINNPNNDIKANKNKEWGVIKTK